jgi:hypothetical protein
VIGFDAHAIRHLAYRHPGGSGQQFGEDVFVLGVEAPHKNEGHASVGRQVFEQLSECLQPPGGSAYADNGKILASNWLGY